MIQTVKLLSIIFFFNLFLTADTKEYEKDLKLNLTLTAFGSLGDRGVKFSMTNKSKDKEYEISILDNPNPNNCPLYFSFSAFMIDGKGKWNLLSSKYREASPKDFKTGTKTMILKPGTTTELYSMIMPPKKWFVLSGIGASVKLVGHYKYKKREAVDTKNESELKIPAFVLNSDTIIVNIPQ